MLDLFATASIVVIIVTHLADGKDKSCCSECPLYQGLLIEPGCEECAKTVYLTPGQEVELKCSPCNSTFASQINQSKHGNYFWTFWSSDYRRITIKDEHTTRAKSIARISSDGLAEGTLNCYFGPDNNANRALIQGHKNFVVCGRLVRPSISCFTFFHETLNTLAMTCTWKIPDNVDIAVSHGETRKPCGFDYSRAKLVYKLERNIYNDTVSMENEARPCGVENECVTKMFCARFECGNGHLSDFTMLSDAVLVVQGWSHAEKTRMYESKLLPPRTIFKHNSRPFIISAATRTDSCVIAINASTGSMFLRDARFAFSVNVTDRASGRVLRDGKEPIIIPVPVAKGNSMVTRAMATVDGLFPGRLYDFRVNYNLLGSIYTSDVTHLECRTQKSAPALTPTIMPGGYMVTEGRFVLYMQSVQEEQHAAPDFKFVATLKHDDQETTKSQPESPIWFPFNESSNGSVEIQLRCRNSEGWCSGSTSLSIDVGTLNRKPKYVVARKTKSKGYPASQYYVSWSPVSNATGYILHWCQDSTLCQQRFSWTRLDSGAENVLVCTNAGEKATFFISACIKDRCGSRVAAELKDNYDYPPKLTFSAPTLDKTERTLRVSWKRPEDIDLVGFTESQFEYGFDGHGGHFTKETEIAVPCDEIEKGWVTSVRVRQIALMKGVTRRPNALSCLGPSLFERPLKSEWSDDVVFKPEMCKVPESSARFTVVVAVVFLMSAVSLIGLMCVIYFSFQRMTKRFLQSMMDVADRVEHTYAERKAAKDDQEKIAERWILENYGALPEFTDLSTCKGNLRLPLLPSYDQDQHLRLTNSKGTAAIPNSGTLSHTRNVYAKRVSGASASAQFGPDATTSIASSDRFGSTEAPGSAGHKNSDEFSALIAPLSGESSQRGEGTTESETWVEDDGYRRFHIVRGDT